MKKLILILSLHCAIFVSNLSAQWFWQNPKPTGDAINAAYFINESVGFIGVSKAILKTTNGGADWKIYLVDIISVNEIMFINQDIGWCAGVGGKVYKTTDTGESWFLISEISGHHIFAFSFTSETVGYAAASKGSIFKTTDGGYTWNKTILTSVDSQLQSVFFINSENGWTAETLNSYAWHTTNAGETWTQMQLPSFFTAYSIYFLNAKIGFMVGYSSVILKTTNGGHTWSKYNIKTVFDYSTFYDVFFSDSLNGWTVTGSPGANGGESLYKTADGGLTWSRIDNGIHYGYIKKIVFPSTSIGYAVGSLGILQITTNGGENWKSLTSGERDKINSSFFINKDIGWAVGENGLILKTTNGGENWIKKRGYNSEILYSIYFVSENSGWIAGYEQILKTTDGGESWFPQLNYGSYISVFFIDGMTGWAAGWETGGNRLLATTNDGGVTWNSKPVSPFSLRTVYFITETIGFITGNTSKILKTTDGGDTWNEKSLGDSCGTVCSIDFINSNVGFAAGYIGYYGFISKTSDSGETWTRKTNATFPAINTIQFPDDQNGFAIGPRLVFTSDCGENWIVTDSYGNTLSFVSKDIGWIFGSFGSIRKTISGSVLPVDFTTFKEGENFFISQNYPNPFNPSTKLRYNIPSSVKGETGDVLLKVYGILGNEIETLVNEEKSPGTYEVTWNAAGLPSGVYFYQLRTGSFVDTKKMILLR